MKKIAVIGAGTMGNGIAHTFAQFGFPVILVDVSEAALSKGMSAITNNLDRQVQKGILTETQKTETIARITTLNQIDERLFDRDLVVEAASENFQIKSSVFRQLDQFCQASCILASNTSSISITRIAAETKRPAQVIGMHFMNPVPVMKLVEIINGYSTSSQTSAITVELTETLSKIPVVVNDYPGFVANKILMPMINEAIITLHEGVAGVNEIDTVMKLGMAHPMGPLQLADFIGLDVCLSILRVLQDGFGNPKYAPSPLLVNMVMAGQLGVKSGVGFYDYSAGIKQARVADQFA